MTKYDWITDDILRDYQNLNHELVARRLRILFPLGVSLHLVFSFLDYRVYTNLAPLFLKIRIFDSAIGAAVFALTFWRRIKPYNFFLLDVGAVVMSAGVCLMIYLADGAQSHYYEGINLTMLALIVGNGFSYRHNLAATLLMLLCYNLAVLGNQAHWNFTAFLFANFFMGSTALFVALITKFYSDQHYEAFARNEAQKQSEKKLELLYRQAEEMSKTDDLTKISNRRHFFEILKSKIAVSETTGLPFYLIIFDIDNFKQINDRYGHTFGDQVLLSVAQVVNNNIRPNSNLGRYGGDEFMMIFDKATKEEILKRVEGISYAIRGIPLSVNNQQPLNVSASFGVVRYEPGRGVSETGLVEASDRELMKVKQTRRGGISLGNSWIS